MDHPLRTLLYELFLEPFLGPLQHPLGRRGNALPTGQRYEEGNLRENQISKIESKANIQLPALLVSQQCAGVDVQESPRARQN
jgi:hypothetical protein